MSGFFDQEIDEEVLSACRAGESGAQGRLYEVFAAPVFTLALRVTGSRALADEVVQDTFVEVLTKIHQYRGEAPIGAWIRRIAVNKGLGQLRSPWFRRGQELHTDVRQQDVDHSVNLDLETSLMRLSTMARAVLWLHDVEGYTHKEIGGFMGKTASFSKSQLSRAHQRLQNWAQDELAATAEVAPNLAKEKLDEESCIPALNN
ncbi:MAG: RNA polymerase sigma factor [Gammaproteobacteria bacterium]|nr:RNA polymerase sigma factor [Gammaproteobacteria bacterium]